MCFVHQSLWPLVGACFCYCEMCVGRGVGEGLLLHTQVCVCVCSVCGGGAVISPHLQACKRREEVSLSVGFRCGLSQEEGLHRWLWGESRGGQFRDPSVFINLLFVRAVGPPLPPTPGLDHLLADLLARLRALTPFAVLHLLPGPFRCVGSLPER